LSAAAQVAQPPPAQTAFRRILLASEGRPIPPAAVARAVELAKQTGASVHVFTIARIHGTAFGMPSPGLFPSKKEWAEQRDIVAKTIKRLERKGLEADGHVLGTRSAWKKIIAEAKKENCEAIVMAADTDRNRVSGNMMWTQEPQRVKRKAKLPVYLVPDESG
jgi:nucleotide-binding universal stress UspA family protein